MIVITERKEATKLNNALGYMSQVTVFYNYSTDEGVLIRDVPLEELLANIDNFYYENYDVKTPYSMSNVRKEFVHPCLLNLRSWGASTTKELIETVVNLIAEAHEDATKISADLRSVKKLLANGEMSSSIDDFQKRNIFQMLTIWQPYFEFKKIEFTFGDRATLNNAVITRFLKTEQINTIFNQQLFSIVQMLKDFLLYCIAERILLLPAYTCHRLLNSDSYSSLELLVNDPIINESRLAINEFSTSFKGDAISLKRQHAQIKNSIVCLYACGVVKSFADIPYKLILEVNAERYFDRDYKTSSQRFSINLIKAICALERTDWKDCSNYIEFDDSKASIHAAKRTKQHRLTRSNASLDFAAGKIDEKLKSQMHQRCQNKSGEEIKRISFFVDYLIYLETQGHGIKKLSELNHFHFYDSFDRLPVSSFYNFFIKTKSAATSSTKIAIWSTIRRFVDECLKDEEVVLMCQLDRYMPLAKTLFNIGTTKRNVTTRASMPSLVHELCFEILVANDYEFARNHSKNYTAAQQYNYEIGEYDQDVFHPNVAHALHMLLIFPARTHQVLWVDEGLMDEMRYDHSSDTFVENNHLMRAKAFEIDYQGILHAKRFPNQAFVIADETTSGEICLNFNTNKTKLVTLQKKGITGYQIPWIKNSGIDHLDDVLRIVERQKEFNKKYSPHDLVPVNPMDQKVNNHQRDTYELLPMGTPLFRDLTRKTISSFDPIKTGLYLPNTNDAVRSLFYALLDEVDKVYRKRYGATNHSIVRDRDGGYIYDLHGLRVYGITNLLSKGVDVSVVQMLVGHATEIMTRYYKKLSNQNLRQIILEARKNAGQMPKSVLEFIETHASEELVALFDLLPEWNQYTAMRPNFTKGGRPTRMKGGVCAQFDCATGGLEIDVLNAQSEKVKITSLKGGAMSCGNCRYWRSSPELIADQIYYMNLIAEEIDELTKERQQLVTRGLKVKSDASLNPQAAQLAYENYHVKADEINSQCIYKIIERINREKMLNECVSKLSVESGTTLPTLKNELYASYGDLSEFDRCFEQMLQAVDLGIDQGDTVNMRKVLKFMNQLYSATKQENPFLFMPSDELRQLALVSKMYEAQSMLGQVDDDEFNDARKLIAKFEAPELQRLNRVLKNDSLLLLTSPETNK